MKTSNTDKVLKPGQMAPNSKANTSRVKSTEKELSLGLMDLLILDNSLKIIFKETESITGPMAESSTDHG